MAAALVVNSSSGSASGGNSDSDTPDGAQQAQQPSAGEGAAPLQQQGQPAQQEDGGAAAEPAHTDDGCPQGDGGDGSDEQKPKLSRPVGVAACPRCNSEETKFCYYNNYNVKQPRYFCKARLDPAPAGRLLGHFSEKRR